ncbi:MAG: site-2 protease family protein [Planctomycetota bacterium]
MRTTRVGSALGVPIEIHHLMLLLPLFCYGDLPFLLLLISLYFCILLHELGHIRIIQWFGFPVEKIVLSLLGGTTKIGDTETVLHFAQKPKKEFLMAIAGPIVNFVLAGYFLLSNFFFPNWFFTGLASLNLLLGVFNLFPAFPMDGGRILRAIFLWRGKVSYSQATAKTLKVGNLFFFVFLILGLYSGNFFIVFFIFFLYLIGKVELVKSYQIESLLSPPIWPNNESNLVPIFIRPF